MITVLILEKTYHVAKHSSAKALNYILTEELEDLDVEISEINFTKERYAEITIDGDDEVIAKNFLIERYGTKRSIADLKTGDKIKGRFKEVGKVKFGTFIDAGIVSSTKNIDALFPLFKMREQLASGNKVSLMNLVKAYGIIDNIPLNFEVIKRQVIGSKVWLKLTEDSLQWLKEPIKAKKEALIIAGTTRRMIKTALLKTHHTEDIDEIERIGLLEYRMICKKGTRAEGIIPEIGFLLGRAKIGAIALGRINNLIKTNK